MDKLPNQSGVPAENDGLRGRMRTNADGYTRRHVVPAARPTGSQRNYSGGEQKENPTGSSHRATKPQPQQKSYNFVNHPEEAPKKKQKVKLFKKLIIRNSRRRKQGKKKLFVVPALFLAVLIASLIGTTFINNPQKVEAAIAVRASQAGTAGNDVTSKAFSVPTGMKEGDIMIAIVSLSANEVMTQASWTSIAICSNTNLRVQAWRKQATAADANTPGSYTWTWTNTNNVSGGIVAYSGVNRTTPIGTIGTCATGSSTTASSNGITSTSGRTVVAAFGLSAANATGQTLTVEAALNARINGTSTDTTCLLCTPQNAAYALGDLTSTGNTTAKTASSTETGTWGGVQFELIPNTDPTLEQSAYRWLTNADSITPGAALAANNTAITAFGLGDRARLRLLLHVSGAEMLIAVDQLKLRYAVQSGGSCTATPAGNYSDLSDSTGVLRYYTGNTTVNDGDDIAATANDPTHNADIKVPQEYEEANNFVSRTITPTGQDAMWDFAITNNSAPANTIYCFRVTKSDGTAINTYSQFPQLTTRNVLYNQAAYRWFNPNNGTAPGTALGAGQDTAITQVNTNADFRLRMLIDNGGTDAIPAAYESFKLQYAVRGADNTCDVNFTNETYGDVATASGAIRYKDNVTPIDNDTAVTATGDPTYLGHVTNLHFYKEANNFTTRISQPATQAGLWDFSLTNNSAPFGTVYCFRAIKSDGVTTLNTYTQVPQLTIINPTFDQKAYRWYDSSNTATPPGAVRAATNVATTNVSPTAQFRLRMLVRIGGDPVVANTETFKLKFATKTAGTCGAYSDVDPAAGVVRFNSAPTPADEASITTFADDPVDAGITIRGQTYQEANNFTVATATAIGEDAMWDFSLQTVSAPLRTTYCFKIVRSTDADINTYSVTPELTTTDPRYEQAAYRWLNNADSITPGSALAANNTPVTDISQNTIVRLRMLTHVSNNTHTTGVESFKLQFAQKSGTCDVAFTGETYADLLPGSGALRYYDNPAPADGAAIATTANDPAHNSDVLRAQTYEEANNFTSTSQIAAGEDGLWDFAIQNVSAAQNTSWCFRIIKTDGTTDFTTSGGSYSQVAELNTAPVSLSQSAYRWFQNVNIADMLTITNDITAGDDKPTASAIDAAGGWLYVGGYDSANANQWRLEKRNMATGDLDPNFNSTGFVNSNNTGDDSLTALTLDTTNGYIYAVGYDSPGAIGGNQWRIEKRKTSNGNLCTAAECGTQFGTNGVLQQDISAGSDQAKAIAVDITNGYIYVGGFENVGTGDTMWRLEKRRADNANLCTAANCGTAFDTDGIWNPAADFSNKLEEIKSIQLDTANGYVYFGGQDGTPGGALKYQWRIEKRRTSDAAPCTAANCGTAFDTDGIWTTANTGSDSQLDLLNLDLTNGVIYVAGWDSDLGDQWRIEKINASDATYVAAFGASGIVIENVTGGADRISDLKVDNSGGHIYVVGYDSTGANQWRLEKRKTSNGNLCTAAECGTAFDTDGILTGNHTAGDDKINQVELDVGNSRLYAIGYDSGGANQWRYEKRKMTDGTRGWEPPSALVAQDTKITLTSLTKFRLRMLVHVSGENMGVNGETLKLQIAQKVGTCDSGYIGEIYEDVGTTGDITYYDNTNITDASATVSIDGDPSHTGHTNIPETYEEANPFTFPNAVTAGQDGLWDFALIDNTAFGNYCFRVVKNADSSTIAASVVPEVVFCDKPKTENLLRGGNYFCDDSEKKFFWN